PALPTRGWRETAQGEEQARQLAAGARAVEVTSVRVLGKPAQQALVEPALDRRPGSFALDVGRASLIVEHRHDLACARPDPDREHADAAARDLVDRRARALLQVLAVGPQHDGLLLAPTVRHHAARHAQRLAEIGPRLAHSAAGQRLDGGPDP